MVLMVKISLGLFKENKNKVCSTSLPNQFTNLRNGVLLELLGSSVKRLSALRPSATTNTSLEAGGASGVDWGVMPWTKGDVK